MDIQGTYIGGWFQRTVLHLSEIHYFLNEGKSTLSLDHKKLVKLQKSLDIESLKLSLDGFEYIEVITKNQISFKIFEDGLIVLKNTFSHGDNLPNDIKDLTNYYENKLSPAISYLFSLGAPMPKELANIKTVYPYFVVVMNATHNDIERVFTDFNQSKDFEINNDGFDIVRGDKFYIINLKQIAHEDAARFIEEQIFLREFKGQLHRYLNLHRIIWERIADVKERGKINGAEIASFRDKVEGYAKTINLIEARMNQMGTYLHTRERIARTDKRLVPFNNVIAYGYETLGDTLSYLQQIWVMTKNYVNSALQLFTDLQSQVTQSSVENLTVVTTIGVGATLIGLFTTTSVPELTVFGLMYVIILGLIGFSANHLINWISTRRSYKISDIEYDKEI
ncbi:hypothetical protein HGA91_02820 [candidate division WWE3 bacterium]|nr:hypothetical protein [candidate division WWE3 bacterium]